MTLSRRHFLASGLLTALYGSAVAATEGSRLNLTQLSETATWRNWSGALESNPESRLAPSTEDQLIDALRMLKTPIRPVGAGHSFSPLVPTDGTLVVMDKLNGLLEYDEKKKTAVLGAGTRLGDAGPLLENIGQAMYNLPDIDRQTLAGAISTSTHGTGGAFGSLSHYVKGLRLITPRGEVMDLSATNKPDLFDAARVSLGAFGLITRIDFQNRESFRLRSSVWVEKTEDVIDSFDERTTQYEHYEFMPFVHADYSLVIAHKETDDPVATPAEEESGGDLFGIMARIPVFLRRPIINFIAQAIPSAESVEASHLALTNVRNDRFNEMEYSVPVDAGLACVREILQTVSDLGIDVLIPLEYRVVAGDDTWLSMFAGGPRASISIHRIAGYDYKPYFDVIEPIFWKYNGRPHWGKVHSLGYGQLTKLYPRLEEFKALQKTLDPEGQMLNEHLRALLGIDA